MTGGEVIVEKRKRRRGCGPLLITLGIVGSIGLGVFCFVAGLIIPMFDAGGVANAALTALHDREYARIYPLMEDRVRTRYETDALFAEAIINQDLPIITDWYFDNFESTGSSILPDVETWATILGGVTFSDGEHARVVISLDHSGEAWQIDQISIWRDAGTLIIP